MSVRLKSRLRRCICSARDGLLLWRLLPAAEVLPAVAYPSPNNRCM